MKWNWRALSLSASVHRNSRKKPNGSLLLSFIKKQPSVIFVVGTSPIIDFYLPFPRPKVIHWKSCSQARDTSEFHASISLRVWSMTDIKLFAMYLNISGWIPCLQKKILKLTKDWKIGREYVSRKLYEIGPIWPFLHLGEQKVCCTNFAVQRKKSKL